jgi:dienelactone hydrolase
VAVPVRALVLLGGQDMSQEAKDFLASIDTPVYTGASILDRPVFKDMAEVYANSKNPDSFMFAPIAAERGMNLLHHSNFNRSAQTDIEVINLMQWLEVQVKNLGRVEAVSFKTKDGWTIHGNLRHPDELGKTGKKIPGVIQVSGARSNRYSMLKFEEEFSRRGFAVLSIELRGRGASMQGLAYDSPEVQAVRENLLGSPYELDTMGAVDFLSAYPGIDSQKIAIVGEARGSRSALLAAPGDKRIKTLILLSVYDPDPEMEAAARKLEIPVLFVDGETNWAAPGTMHIYRLVRRGQLMMFPGMGHSHHIPYFHPQVTGLMADYLERELPGATPIKQYEEKQIEE